ncbi:hypothetical protein BH09PSE2_BH09PSE2_05080 [soil metagenome]
MTAPHRKNLTGEAYHLGGFQWWFPLDAEADYSDSAADPTSSRLSLYEDDVALGPWHSPHEEIEALGHGRYSHWGRGLRFSSRDGSCPNTNGRHYSFGARPRRRSVVGFGACHTLSAVASLERRGFVKAVRLGDIPTHTVAEAQVSMGSTLGECHDCLDDLIIELSSSVNFISGANCVTRSLLSTLVVNPVISLGPSYGALCAHWLNAGLIRCDEAVRLPASLKLAEACGNTAIASPELDHLIRNITGVPCVAENEVRGAEDLAHALGCRSLTVITSPNTYLPDGRPFTWPGNYPAEVRAACMDRGVSLLQCSSLIKRFGIVEALELDRVHFRPEFYGRFGDAIFEILFAKDE